ncbi:hypothetical protein NGF75_09835 [Dietzia kunjamensis]|uniref:hypothetical protein n=1 Tax=Dietzia kunjamensis TaxID=322509 RepID=UPI002DB5CE52|nr:hypothetical protein [Dietzia kunjamensis]MEB8326289.1 hypothetical protein [Dietzia kunjamensis]
MTPVTAPADDPPRAATVDSTGTGAGTAAVATVSPRTTAPVIAAQAEASASRVRATLRPGTVVVARDDHTVQVGLAPDRAVVVDAPATVGARSLSALLRGLEGGAPLDDVAARAGIDAAGMATVARILVHLADLDHLRLDPPEPGTATDADAHATGSTQRPAPVRRVHILGVGQISEVLRGPLSVNGCRVTTGPSPGLTLDAERPPWFRRGVAPDLVILTGTVSVDPVVTTALARSGQTHMHVYCRDGRVVVGPTVVPGVTPCLRCTDLYRARRDPRWPFVAAQLIGHSPEAAVPALTAAAALVLAEVAASREPRTRLQTIGATVEINPSEGLWRRLEWQADAACDCGAAPHVRPLS